MHNLAYPQWAPVDCRATIPVDVICTKTENKQLARTNGDYNITKSVQTSSHCQTNQILFADICLFFTKNSNRNRINKETVKTSSYPKSIMKYLSLVSESVLCFQFPFQNNFSTSLFTFDSVFSKMKRVDKMERTKSMCSALLFVFTLGKVKSLIKHDLQQYLCKSGELISMDLFHNRQLDCLSSDDESQLKCYLDGKLKADPICVESCTKVEKCKCHDLYFKSIRGGCYPYSTLCGEHNCNLVVTENGSVPCFNVTLQTASRQHLVGEMDVLSDCTMQESNAFENSAPISSFDECGVSEKLPWTYGCSKCFAISKLCVYELDREKRLMHCPSGAHLKNCNDMECSNMFKCFQSHCIPFRFVFGF